VSRDICFGWRETTKNDLCCVCCCAWCWEMLGMLLRVVLEEGAYPLSLQSTDRNPKVVLN
jgi:hypothetical protein